MMASPNRAAFALASFFGAYLLFQIQPIMARQILPWFGGASAVWSTCLVFFQGGLVAGYVYAHLTRRLGVRRQAVLHLALLAVAAVALPIEISPDWKPADPGAPVTRVLGLLALTVGGPYLLLAATAPLLQDWFARALRAEAPYRLYVPSNVGSLGALLSYPLVVEPLLSVESQVLVWRLTLAGFVGLCGWCGWVSVRGGRAGTERVVPNEPAPRPGAVALWTALAACGSALLLAVTNHLSQEVAAVPMLWVVPLSLYLATFIACFAERYDRRIWTAAFSLALLGALWALAPGSDASLALQTTVLLGLLTAGCMVCHGELVRHRPDPAHLTTFYVTLAVGGSLGGAAVAIGAPLVFDSHSELPFLVLLVPALLLISLASERARRARHAAPVVLWTIPALVFVAALGSALAAAGTTAHTVAAARDFYGVLRVVDDAPGEPRRLRGLLHGRIIHGSQYLDPGLRNHATTYYAESSGIELAIRLHPERAAGRPLTVGVVGLGTGTLAAWAAPGDLFRFFELSPLVIDFGARYFSFLDDSAGAVEVVEGDARLSLERELAQGGARRPYDVLAVDAFSGDAIPVHLMTRESLEVYRAALAPDGVLAFHVSNQHLDLRPVVRALAGALDWPIVEVIRPADPDRAIRKSQWMLLTSNPHLLEGLQPFAAPDEEPARSLLWTDSFSSLWPLIEWR